jgi:HD-like signal output (HDOD) protein
MRQQALSVLGSLPPFSIILNRLMASLAGEDIGFAKLGDLIEKDTVIAGNLLFLVNSALYARRGTVNSVRHALSLLGIEKVRNTVLSMSIMRVWNLMRMPASWSMARFNIHSSAVAILSDCVVQRVPVNYGEGAFVAGLLHDVGRLLIAMGLPEEHEQLATGGDEERVLGFGHAELSAEALAYWNIPEPIQMAVRFHHNPEADNSTVTKKEIRLSRILSVADEYVNSLGMSIMPTTGLKNNGDAAVFSSLGFNEEQTADLLVEFNTERDAMATFFT